MVSLRQVCMHIPQSLDDTTACTGDTSACTRRHIVWQPNGVTRSARGRCATVSSYVMTTKLARRVNTSVPVCINRALKKDRTPSDLVISADLQLTDTTLRFGCPWRQQRTRGASKWSTNRSAGEIDTEPRPNRENHIYRNRKHGRFRRWRFSAYSERYLST